jgi:hypothetical protein
MEAAVGRRPIGKAALTNAQKQSRHRLVLARRKNYGEGKIEECLDYLKEIVSEAPDGPIKRKAELAKRALEVWLRYQTADPATMAMAAQRERDLWLQNAWVRDHPEWPADDFERMQYFPCSHSPEEGREWDRWVTAVNEELKATFRYADDLGLEPRQLSCPASPEKRE